MHFFHFSGDEHLGFDDSSLLSSQINRERREIKQQIRKQGLRSTLPAVGLLQWPRQQRLIRRWHIFHPGATKDVKKKNKKDTRLDPIGPRHQPTGSVHKKHPRKGSAARRNVSNYQICSRYLLADSDSGDITFVLPSPDSLSDFIQFVVRALAVELVSRISPDTCQRCDGFRAKRNLEATQASSYLGMRWLFILIFCITSFSFVL